MTLFRGSLLEPPDRLLWWASEVGDDRWVRWRETCLAVGLNPTAAARWFSALGHVEFDWVERRFRTALPTLAPLVPGGRTWLLRGARRRSLTEALLSSHRDRRDSVTWIAADERLPSRWYFSGEPAAAASLAGHLGVTLGGAPSDTATALGRATWADGTTMESLSDEQREQLKSWGDLRIAERGLYKRRQLGTIEGWVHRRDGSWWRASTWQLAPYMAAADRPEMPYDRERGALRVPNLFQLPPEHERALVMHSGLVPVEVGAGTWAERAREYRAVPDSTAREVASALSARLAVRPLRQEAPA